MVMTKEQLKNILIENKCVASDEWNNENPFVGIDLDALYDILEKSNGEVMTPQEKAKDKAERIATDEENPHTSAVILSCYVSAMKMYEWAKEQFIQNACKYIKKNVCEHISHNQIYKDYKQDEVIGYQLVVDEQFYVDFKQAMEG